MIFLSLLCHQDQKLIGEQEQQSQQRLSCCLDVLIQCISAMGRCVHLSTLPLRTNFNVRNMHKQFHTRNTASMWFH